MAFGQRLISTGYSIDVEHYIYNLGFSNANWYWWNSLNRWGLVFINKLILRNSLPVFSSNYLSFSIMIMYAFLFNYLFYTYIDEKYFANLHVDNYFHNRICSDICYS